MKWRFTLIDKEGAETEIDEPVGWDAVSIEVSRDKAAHGIFFDYQGNDFLFYKEAFHLLKAAYEADGIEAYYILKIEQECGDAGLQELYRGRLLFAKAVFNCGDECFAKLPIETVSEVMTLRNRWDQPVDLQTLKGFDEETELQPYRRLGADVMLPAKGIVIQDYSKVDGSVTEDFLGGVFEAPKSGCLYNATYHQLYFGFNKEVASEIGSYGFDSNHFLDEIDHSGHNCANCGGQTFQRYVGGYPVALWPLSASAALSYDEGTRSFGEISNPVQVEFALNGKLNVLNSYLHYAVVFFIRLPGNKTGEDEADYDWLFEYPLFHGGIGNCPPDGEYPPNGVIDIAFAHQTNVVLNKGDRLYFFMAVSERKNKTMIDSGKPAFRLTTDDVNQTSFFKVTNLSKTDPTPSKLFLINESISRVAEAITDDNIRAYSDYFGRVDSEPYVTEKDGCGSLAGITNGIFVRRQEKRVADQPSPMAVSMKDLFAGLNPIYNVGFGIEKDPFREGYSVLRVEPWKYFYQSEILMYCDAVDNIEKTVQDAEHYSTFQIGYAKWEAEQYNGLDEFLTKRKYRTTLSTVKNELTQLSKFIASGYALEITRRQQTDSKDWRFDNDTFIICMKRGGAKAGALIYAEDPHTFQIAVWGDDFSFWDSFFAVGDTIHIDSADNAGEFTITDIENITGNVKVTVAETVNGGLGFGTITNLTGGMAVELGNVTNPQNIIDPPTIYNYRISPARNALRWMDTILSSYRQAGPDAKIIFMDGEGNFAASGKMQSPVCRLEKEELSENQSLDISVFANAEKGLPLLRGERVSFEYPMSAKDFRTLLQLPYGIIAYRNNCEEGRGWIDNIKYQPNEGLATFTLIPEITEL